MEVWKERLSKRSGVCSQQPSKQAGSMHRVYLFSTDIAT